MLSDEQIKKLEMTANTVRQDIIAMLLEAKTGHSAGPLVWPMFLRFCITLMPLSIIRRIRIGRKETESFFPMATCPVLYAAMARAGYFPAEELKTLRKFGSRLQGHPHRLMLPGLETSSRTARFRLVAGGRHGLRFSFR